MKRTIERIFSAHEHLGIGQLSFSNGTVAEYDASPQKLSGALAALQRETGCRELKCILYPQMPYKKYSTPREYMVPTEKINAEFYRQIPELPQEYEYFPFLYLRCRDSRQYNEDLIRKYRSRCFGIKLHPEAELIGTKEFFASEILRLAEEYALPITIHCSRSGGVFDFSSVSRQVFPQLGRKKVRMNLAHLGFFDKAIFEESLPDNVYMDLSPVGVIQDQYLLSGGCREEFVKKFAAYVSQNAESILYGGDFPYNLQKWEDGSVHGTDTITDLKFLLEMVFVGNESLENYVFYKNTMEFVGII